MKRRQFIQRAGWAVAGAGPVFSAHAEAAPAQAPGDAAAAETVRSRVLVTQADSPLGRALAAGLAAAFEIRRTSPAAAPQEDAWAVNGLGSVDEARQLLDGVGQIVHPAGFAGRGDETPLELPARETYQLLSAAAAAGVTRVVCLSTLELVSSYDISFAVREDWLPIPAAAAPGLSAWLVECVGREFAREGRLEVLVLRLGQWGEPPADGGNGLPRISPADAVRAVASALKAKTVQDPRGPRGWDVVHVHSEPGNPRFPLDKARRALGFQPGGE